MNTRVLAAIDRCVRPLLSGYVPPKYVVSLYSGARKNFINQMCRDLPHTPVAVPQNLAVTCWGLKFRSPLFNAAGMFKNGEGYEFCRLQGAGAFLAGTTTSNPRVGNEKTGIRLPFTPYPRSGAASNWLGLPNDGDDIIAGRIKSLKSSALTTSAGGSAPDDFPIGISVMGSPDLTGDEKLNQLIRGMALYRDAGVDFIEINESCPNTAHGSPQNDDLAKRLERIKSEFLDAKNGSKRPPVIVKFSNDTELEQVGELLDLLIRLGYDGVNFGNSSTQYSAHAKYIAPQEQRLYRYFTDNFGGGVTGRPLRSCSLALVERAALHLKNKTPGREFHIIRTGGVETAADVQASLKAGASLVQWYTGFFDRFAHAGHNVYKELYAKLEG